MGIAAYRRGNVGIHRDLMRQFGFDCGCPVCHTPHVTPRPSTWGAAAAARALDYARRVIRGAERYGRPLPDEAMLANVVREGARVGDATAMQAARSALSESP